MEAEATNITEPDFAFDEAKDGYVRVKINIPGLKVKSSSLINQITHRHHHPVGKNAEIEAPIYNERSFAINIKGHSDDKTMNGKHYRLVIEQLPHDIVADKCFLEGKDDWIYLHLRKKDEFQSWSSYVMKGDYVKTTG